MAFQSHPLLPRNARQARSQVALAPGLTLVQARLHEGCGRARHSLAIWLASRLQGPVFWIAPRWSPNRLNPDGMVALGVEPARFTFLATERPIDTLWSMEEVLRSGAVPLVVACLPDPPGLTPVRRLHLAAETGAREGAHAPLGLILTPGAGGAPGVESRWRMEPDHGSDHRRWHLSRLRARTQPVRDWQIGPAKVGFAILDRVPEGVG